MNGKIMLNGKAYSSSGRPSREITMAQWLALPDTKYTDGIVYYIKDVGGANQFPPLIYSDEEREIGVWRDGKPLYEKTFTNVANGTQILSGIDTVVDFRVSSHGAGVNSDYHVIGDGFTTASSKVFTLINGNVTFTSWTSTVSETEKTADFLIIQYTKTTDTAGAGTWTTDGTYAKHYSTEEKVIGTWIDGKPLYEKSYVTSQFSGGYDITTDIPFDGAFVVSGYYLLNDSNGSMIGLNEWFASANYSFCHVEKATKKIRCYLMGYTGIGYFTIQYTKTTD